MKTQLLTLSLLLTAMQSAKALDNAKDLAINCQITTKVDEIYNMKFNPGLPAQGRFDGTPSSYSFNSKLTVLSQTPGCAVLKSKYDIFIGDTLYLSGGKTVLQEGDVSQITATIGQTMVLTVQQYIGLQLGKGYLPLFPKVHQESLSLSGEAGDHIGFGMSLDFNINWVYNMLPIESLSDIEKLSLAEKAAQYLFVNEEYGPLFLKLEPASADLKKSYALLIWKAFHKLMQAEYPKSEYLQFHVGGSGYYYSKHLAEAFNKISQPEGTFSATELSELIAEFPTWLFVGFSTGDCLNYSSQDLETALEKIKLKAPLMTPSEKYLAKDPIEQIAGNVNFMIVGPCLEQKVTPKAKTLAFEILPLISQ